MTFLQRVFGEIFHRLLLGLLLFFTIVLLCNYSLIWPLSDHHIPPTHLFIRISVFALVIIAFEFFQSKKLRILGNFLAASILLLTYISETLVPLGDAHWPVDAQIPELVAPSIFGHLMLYIAHRVGLNLNYIAPISGFFTAFLFLSLCDYLLKDMDTFRRSLGKICYVGSAIQVVFFFGYIEVTMISLPSLLLFIYFLMKYLESNHESLKHLLFMSGFFTIGGITHGQTTFLFPAIPILIIWKNDFLVGWKKSIKEISINLAFMGCILYLSLKLLDISGFQIVPGDISGGGDGILLVPLAPQPNLPYLRFTLFSIEHLVEVANILLITTPFFMAYGICVLLRAILKKPLSPQVQDTHALTLTILSLGYLGFIFMFGFDLGYPRDLDLMISMSLPLSLLFIRRLLISLKNMRIIGAFMILLCIVMTWSFVASFLVLGMPCRELIGQHVRDVNVTGEVGVVVEFNQTAFPRNIDPESGLVPSRIMGEVLASDRSLSQLYLAIAVDGTIQAVTQTFKESDSVMKFSAILPETSFRAGKNDIEVFVVSGDPLHLQHTQSGKGISYSLVKSDRQLGDMIVSSSGASIPVIPDVIQGSLEYPTRTIERDVIIFYGWAADVKNSQLPETILIFVDGKFVFSGRTNKERPDRVEVFDDTALLLSGFKYVLPLGLFNRTAKSKIRLFAVSKKGVASELDIR